MARIESDTFTWLSPADRFTSAVVQSGLIVTSEVGWDTYRSKTTIRDADYEPLAEVENLGEEPLVAAAPHRLPAAVDAVQTVVLWPTEPTEGPLPVLMNPYGGPHAQRVLASRSGVCERTVAGRSGFLRDRRRRPRNSGAVPAVGTQHRRATCAILHSRTRSRLCTRSPRATRTDWTCRESASWAGPTGVTWPPWPFWIVPMSSTQRSPVHRSPSGGSTTRRTPSGTWAIRAATHDRTTTAVLLPLAEPSLSRPLMLIHGLADDNVFAAHTLRLSTELLKAGKPHEVLPLSGVSHMTPQPEVAENLLHMQVGFFRRHLQA